MSKVKGFQDEEYHLLQDKSAKQEDQKESPIEILEKNFNTSNDTTLRKLWIASGVCLIFMIIEVIGGYLANSIAIMSDAAHLLSDILGFIISIVSIYISRRGATTHMSYGYHRAEVIGALVSVTLIWGLTIWLLYEASLRIMSNNEVNGLIMLITAVIGFVFNIIMGVILAYEGIDHNLHSHHDHEGGDHGHSHGHSHAKIKEPDHGHAHDDNDHNHAHAHDDGKEHNHEHNHEEHGHSHDEEEEHNHSPNQNKNNGHSDHENVNLRAALIHVIGDAIQNLGVVIAGAVIYFYPKASIADPICTFIFSIIVGFSTIRILKDCISVLMEGSPRELEIKELERDLSDIKGVVEVHDLHVWSLSIGKVSLSCHLTSNNPQISLKKARKLIKDKYKISHSTIQVELDSEKSFEDCAHDLHHEVNNN